MVDRLCKGPQPRVGRTLGVVVAEVVQIPKFRHHRDRVPLVALILESLPRGHGDDVRFAVLLAVSVVASRRGLVFGIEEVCFADHRLSSVAYLECFLWHGPVSFQQFLLVLDVWHLEQCDSANSGVGGHVDGVVVHVRRSCCL